MSSSSRRMAKQKKQKIIIAILGTIIIFIGVGLMLSQVMNKEKKITAVSTGNGIEQNSATTIKYQGVTYRYNDHLSNYLFMGIDTREEVDSYHSQHDAGQADSIFLVSMDRVTEKVRVLVIPRDTITEIEVFNPAGKSLGHTRDHINIQYAYGDGQDESCKLMKKAVSALLGNIPVHNYCALNMDGIPFLTEAVGGVTVIVPDNSLKSQNPDFYQGAEIDLDRDNTEMFVRYRDTSVSGSAMVRQGRQKVYMKALVDKAQKEAARDASFVVDIYESLKPYMVTNMGNDLFADLLEASASESVEPYTVPGEVVEGGSFDEYHVHEEELQALLLEIFYEKLE